MSRIVFMGTPDFAVPILKALIAHHTVIAVVTQPDRPAGRRGELRPPPVKSAAQDNGIPVFQPEKLRRKTTIEELRSLGVPDMYVVAAFGQILPQSVLDIPPQGAINVHASLLPRWRGAAPIQAAIRAGDSETGITIMKMDAGLDTGPMLSRRTLPIAPYDTGQTLHDKLSIMGAALLIETLPLYLSGQLTPEPQNDSHATYAPQIDKSEGLIDWKRSADEIERLVRAFTPWPGTYSVWNGTLLKIHRGTVTTGQYEPGSVTMQNGQIAIGTGSGLFLPEEVQLAGRNRTSIDEFVHGYPDFLSAKLG